MRLFGKMPTIVTSAPVWLGIKVARRKVVLAATGVTTETVGLSDNGNYSTWERSNGSCSGNTITFPHCKIGTTERQ